MSYGTSKLGLATATGLACVMGLGSDANASFITGFETSDDAGYIAGQTVVGVDGWQRLSGENSQATVIAATGGPVHSGTQALEVSRPDTANDQIGMFGRYFDDVTVQDVPRIDVRMAANDADSLGFLYVGDDQLVDFASGDQAAVQFGFNGAAIVYNDGGTGVTAASSFTAGEYYHFVADVDLTADTYDLTITGTGVNFSASDIGFRDPAGATVLSSLMVYQGGTEDSLFVDDLSVAPIPEPATLGLLGVGGLLMLSRRRRDA